MKIFVMALVIGLVSITTQAAGVHFSFIETDPGTWEVYTEVTGTGETLGLSAYALWIYDIAPGTVSYEETNLFTLNASYELMGFTNPTALEYYNYPVNSFETAFNIGNYQNFETAIYGVGLTPVNETTNQPYVQLGVPALLGVLTTPEGLGIEGKPAGVETWASPDFGLDVPGGTLLNLTGDGYLAWEDVDVTYSATPFIELVIPLLGDANGNGVVSASDYSTVQANFGNTGEAWMLGDANGDGVVSAGDYAVVQANFGNVSAASETVPEPATIFVMACGMVAIFRRHRRG
jgi:hypothetical protein